MSEALTAEFDTLAEWTARVAVDLGTDFYIPAACRGSGSPAALDWLLERMALRPGELLLDCGAGVGGPAAYAAVTHRVRTTLVEPEKGACRAARRRFDHHVVQAVGTALPLPDATFDAAWALGVLCTTTHKHTLLSEMTRIVRPQGRIGLLVFVAEAAIDPDYVEDSHFPTGDELARLLTASPLTVEHRLRTSELAAIPPIWTERVERVDQMLAQRYGHTEAWQLADRQSTRIGKLLADGDLYGELLVLRALPAAPG